MKYKRLYKRSNPIKDEIIIAYMLGGFTILFGVVIALIA